MLNSGVRPSCGNRLCRARSPHIRLAAWSGVAQEVLLASQFVAAGAMLLLAAWLLWLNFRSTVNRSFAVFLVFRAMVIVANRLKGLAESAGRAESAVFWGAIREYYLLALAPALLYFWVAYSRIPAQRAWRVAIVAYAVVVEGAYMADHCLDLCARPDGLLQLGPLSVLGNPGFLLVAGGVGLWILRDALQLQQQPRP